MSSIMKRCRRNVDLPGAKRLRGAGSRRPSRLGVKRKSLIASVTTRLTSSGIVRSPDRSPASTWATGMPSLVAASVAAIVELTSPTVRTRSGPVLDAAASRCRPEPAAVCSPMGCPSRRRDRPSGCRMPKLLEEDLRHRVVDNAARNGRAATGTGPGDGRTPARNRVDLHRNSAEPPNDRENFHRISQSASSDGNLIFRSGSMAGYTMLAGIRSFAAENRRCRRVILRSGLHTRRWLLRSMSQSERAASASAIVTDLRRLTGGVGNINGSHS